MRTYIEKSSEGGKSRDAQRVPLVCGHFDVFLGAVKSGRFQGERRSGVLKSWVLGSNNIYFHPQHF
jgi:hypothetical protein